MLRRRDLIAAAVATAMPAAAIGAPLRRGALGGLGFAPDLPARVRSALQDYIDAKQLPGGVVTVVRRDKVAAIESAGLANIGFGVPATPKTIYPLFSLSKLLTAVGALRLLENGKIGFDEPVASYLPELAALRVYVSGGQHDLKTEPLKRPVTIRDLLAMRSGLTYAQGDKSFVDDLIIRQGLSVGPTSSDIASLDEYIARLARVPLVFQPGARYAYAPGADVLGAVIQRVTGLTFQAYMKRELFSPLGMVDTDFSVDRRNWRRYGLVYERTADGALALQSNNRIISLTETGEPITVPAVDDPTRIPPATLMPSGAAGLNSTAEDITRFVMMLANGGELNGRRILSHEMVASIAVNQAPSGPQAWGLGFAIQNDPKAIRTKGPLGVIGWRGAGSCQIWVDPHTGLGAVLMTGCYHREFVEIPAAIFGSVL